MDFSSISAAFGMFVESLRTKPLYTILAINLIGVFAALGMLIYVGISDPARVIALGESIVEHFDGDAKVIEPIAVPIPPEEEAKRLQESIPRDKLTCGAINEIGEQLDADRATFWTFSNGSYGTGGVPFNFANVHCPYVKEGVAFIPDDFQKIPNSISAEINTVLFPNYTESKCGYWRREDIQSPYLRAAMKAAGTSEVIQCGVRDNSPLHVPIGKVVISWRDHDANRDITALVKATQATAEAIGRFNTPTIPAQ